MAELVILLKINSGLKYHVNTPLNSSTTAHRITKSQSLAAKKKFVFNEYDIKPRFYSVHILQEESSFLCKIIKK